MQIGTCLQSEFSSPLLSGPCQSVTVPTSGEAKFYKSSAKDRERANRRHATRKAIREKLYARYFNKFQIGILYLLFVRLELRRAKHNARRRARRASDPQFAEVDRERSRNRYRNLSEKDKQKELQRIKDWGRLNPIRRKQTMTEWIQANPDKCREKKRRYRAKPETRKLEKTYLKDWFARPENAGRNIVYCNRRRFRLMECGDVKAINKFISRTKSKGTARCYWCQTRVSTTHIHFDHITPVAKGGKHELTNICVSCQPCNNRKHAKLPTDWLKEGFSSQQILAI